MSAADVQNVDWPRRVAALLGSVRPVQSLRPLVMGAPALFVQTDGVLKNVQGAVDVGARAGLGIVHTLRVEQKNWATRAADLRELGSRYRFPMEWCLFDANEYSGNTRDFGPRTLSREWIELQRKLGVEMLLTDSPYIGDGNLEGLRSVLRQAAGLGPGVIAVLPLHLSWLRRDVELLIAEVNNFAVPAALIAEHANDPFGVQAATAGLLRFIEQAHPPVLVLRCDLSAVGAVAAGASLGAIGVTTGLRHLYPVSSGGGVGYTPGIGLYVPGARVYRRLDVLHDAMEHVTGNPEWWECSCPYCNGDSLEWIATTLDAFTHSMMAINSDISGVITPTSHDERLAAWLEKCRWAQNVNLEIESKGDFKWPCPDYLGAWIKAIEA